VFADFEYDCAQVDGRTVAHTHAQTAWEQNASSSYQWRRHTDCMQRHTSSLGQFKRLLKTHLFGVWDCGALWLTYLLTYRLRVVIALVVLVMVVAAALVVVTARDVFNCSMSAQTRCTLTMVICTSQRMAWNCHRLYRRMLLTQSKINVCRYN